MFQISGTATVNGTSINPTILDFRTLCIRTLKIVAYTRYTIKNYSSIGVIKLIEMVVHMVTLSITITGELLIGT